MKRRKSVTETECVKYYGQHAGQITGPRAVEVGFKNLDFLVFKKLKTANVRILGFKKNLLCN